MSSKLATHDRITVRIPAASAVVMAYEFAAVKAGGLAELLRREKGTE
jgi:hypothetical protein